jgi:DNA primase
MSEGADGRVLMCCHAGCSVEAIVAPLALQVRDLFRSENPEAKTRQWPIRDSAGRSVAFHVRRDGPGGKSLYWERPGGQPGLNGMKVKDLPLYGSELVASWSLGDEPIIITEGEPAADALRGRNIKALATVTGASSCPGPEALAVLRGRDVVLWADDDEVGRQHMTKVANRLAGVAASVRTFTWEGACARRRGRLHRHHG